MAHSGPAEQGEWLREALLAAGGAINEWLHSICMAQQADNSVAALDACSCRAVNVLRLLQSRLRLQGKTALPVMLPMNDTRLMNVLPQQLVWCIKVTYTQAAAEVLQCRRCKPPTSSRRAV
jgi:hypothetical protein